MEDDPDGPLPVQAFQLICHAAQSQHILFIQLTEQVPFCIGRVGLRL